MTSHAGLGLGARETSRRAGRMISESETTLEATYRNVKNDRSNFQPNLQYVIRSDGDSSVRNAFEVGPLLSITYLKWGRYRNVHGNYSRRLKQVAAVAEVTRA